MTRTLTFVILAWCVLIGVGAFLARRLVVAQRSRRRLQAEDAPELTPAAPANEAGGWLRRRLFLAGYRSPAAPAVFIGATLGLLAVGGGVAALLSASGAIQQTAALIGLIPGNALDLFLPLIYGMPWFVVIALGLMPTLVVRNARRARVRLVEQDLPITLELLSTLAESGLAFDAAVDRVISSGDAARPLAGELRQFRAETLSGRPRVSSFRRLARRVQVTAFTTFVSAVVQAEQVGAGMAAVLRRQADDARDRRRERAIEAANALPVKRLVPLAICFMPGIFTWALGPALFEFFRFASVYTRHGGGH